MSDVYNSGIEYKKLVKSSEGWYCGKNWF